MEFSETAITHKGNTMNLEIFMPFYGDVEYFKTAVMSVVNQTDPQWKLTILDDQYPSREPEEFVLGLNDSRITYLRNKQNLGVSQNFQQCLELAEADFINIMGCDDELLDNFVKRTKEIIAANSVVSYIQPGVQIIDEKGQPYLPLGDKVKRRIRNEFNPPTELSGENLASSLLKGCWTYFPSLIWKTSEIKKYNFRSDFTIVLDLALQLEIISGGGSLYVDDEPSFLYRRHRSSVSMKSSLDGTRFIEESQLFNQFAEKSLILGWNKARREANLHLTSRLNALLEIPVALIQRQFTGAGILIRHVFSK